MFRLGSGFKVYVLFETGFAPLLWIWMWVWWCVAMELAGAARDRERVELHLAVVVAGHSDLVLLGTLVGWLAPRSCHHGVVRASGDIDKTKRERVRAPPAWMDGGSARPSAARAALRSPPPLLPVSPSPTHAPHTPLSRPSFTRPPPTHTHIPLFFASDSPPSLESIAGATSGYAAQTPKRIFAIEFDEFDDDIKRLCKTKLAPHHDR